MVLLGTALAVAAERAVLGGEGPLSRLDGVGVVDAGADVAVVAAVAGDGVLRYQCGGAVVVALLVDCEGGAGWFHEASPCGRLAG